MPGAGTEINCKTNASSIIPGHLENMLAARPALKECIT